MVERTACKACICLSTCASTRAVHLKLQRICQRSPSEESAAGSPCIEPWYPTTPLHLWLHPTIWPASVPSAAYKMRLLGGIQNGSSYQSEPCVCGERLIGITNTTLKKVVGKECISHQTLQTVLTDIKAVLNDRPLSYGTKDPEPLTTSHLFYGRGITSLPYKDSGDTANNPETTWTHSNTCSKTVLVYENIAGKQG